MRFPFQAVAVLVPMNEVLFICLLQIWIETYELDRKTRPIKMFPIFTMNVKKEA